MSDRVQCIRNLLRPWLLPSQAWQIGQTASRPCQLSLLNIDLKIYVKILGSHLSQNIPHLVHPDHVGFVPKRQALDGSRFIDLIQWAKQHCTTSLLLSLDTEKAFDRVHWLYLKEVLQKFGLQGTFARAILELYSSPSVRVQTSGITSTPFNITNGTRQRCPLSPLIFSLVMELLAEAIRAHPLISGIQVGSTAHKIRLYADDVTVAQTLIQCNPYQPSLNTLIYLYKYPCTKLIVLSPVCWAYTLTPKWNRT